MNDGIVWYRGIRIGTYEDKFYVGDFAKKNFFNTMADAKRWVDIGYYNLSTSLQQASERLNNNILGQ